MREGVNVPGVNVPCVRDRRFILKTEDEDEDPVTSAAASSSGKNKNYIGSCRQRRRRPAAQGYM